MATVVVSPSNVVTYPEGGGHFWVFMQYVLGLREAGCDVYWLEHHPTQGDARLRDSQAQVLFERMKRFAMDERVILYSAPEDDPHGGGRFEFRGKSGADAAALFSNADLLLNFNYNIDTRMLARFRRTALVDIDPGLLQFWIATGQLQLPEHDLYFTTGETVGTPEARFPDCGLPWRRIRPVICLSHWPFTYDLSAKAFTTVSGWWGGDGKGEWITDGAGTFFENNKRVSFLQFVGLPRRTQQVMELALCLGEGDPEPQEGAHPDDGSSAQEWLPAGIAKEETTDYVSDAADRLRLERNGWRLRHAHEVAGSPDSYRAYIQRSRGEYSCVKPSCIEFQNAWVSDRTLCYLASGKPAVVQHTGRSSYLPSGEGLFRFSDMDEAVDALERVNADYRRHCEAARAVAAEYFDTNSVLEVILDAL
jgi:hypothetical protein